MRRLLTGGFAALAALTLSSSLVAATISGTPRNDNLRGTPKADTISGLGGKDRLFGLGGNDVLNGGAGNDVLSGGPGADTLRCGPGADTALAGPGDKLNGDCEVVQGLPPVGVADATVDEGDFGPTKLSFVVSIAGPVSHPVSVRYQTSDGTAGAPADYSAASGVLQLAPGETSKAIEVTVVGDIDVEPDETFTVALSSPVNATVGDANATGTIRNEDRPRPRAGLYRGTTSLGKPISFEVSPDLTRLSQLSIGFDLRCSNGELFPNESLSFGSAAVPIVPKAWTFSVGFPFEEPGLRGEFRFDGVLEAPGRASGTFTFSFTATSYGISCTTGHVSWSAS